MSTLSSVPNDHLASSNFHHTMLLRRFQYIQVTLFTCTIFFWMSVNGKVSGEKSIPSPFSIFSRYIFIAEFNAHPAIKWLWKLIYFPSLKEQYRFSKSESSMYLLMLSESSVEFAVWRILATFEEYSKRANDLVWRKIDEICWYSMTN